MSDTMVGPKNFFEHIDEVKKRFNDKEIFVFLDYDGTLTPIVATPDLAVMAEDMRGTVNHLSQHFKVAIVSGRATDDVRAKVQLDHLFYAGSHGFEIVSPDGNAEINQQARDIRPVVDEIYKTLSERLKDVEGALVEHVKYTISVHYRLVAQEQYTQIERAVDGILKDHPELRKSSGKKVFELKPNIDWHKGKAVDWILNSWQHDPQKHLAIYIGDDTTDEDAFRALKDKGFGILVAESPRASEAQYMVTDTQEVQQLLKMLVDLRK